MRREFLLNMAPKMRNDCALRSTGATRTGDIGMFRIMGVAVVCLAVTVTAGADVVYLQNGDRISGTLEGLTDSVLRFHGAYANQMEIPWADVLALTTEQEVELVLHERGPLTGRLILLDDRPAVVVDGDTQPVVLDQITAIVVPGVEALEVAEAPEEEEIPEEAAEEVPPEKWSGNVTAGATWQKGATDTFDAALGLAVKREWAHDTLTLTSEGAYGEVESQENTERALGELKWQHYYNDRLYHYWLGGIEHDAGRQLDLRLRTGAGVGREFIKNEKRKLSLEGGIGYRRDRWLEYGLVEERVAKEAFESARQARVTQFVNEIAGLTGFDLISASLRYFQDIRNLRFKNDTVTENSINLYGSSHYEQQVFAKSLFTSDLMIEPEIDDFSRFLFFSDQAFLTPLSEKMSLKIRLTSEYVSHPGSADAEKWEHKFLTGLEYAF